MYFLSNWFISFVFPANGTHPFKNSLDRDSSFKVLRYRLDWFYSIPLCQYDNFMKTFLGITRYNILLNSKCFNCNWCLNTNLDERDHQICHEQLDHSLFWQSEFLLGLVLGVGLSFLGLLLEREELGFNFLFGYYAHVFVQNGRRLSHLGPD